MNLQKTNSSAPPITKSVFGFTLIELIVVITILAILGTIGFLSIWGYSSKARDSARVWDLAQVSKSLDVSIITVGSYPTPDNAFSVTYSWGTIWNQGTIGTTVMQSLRTSISGWGLNKKPVDPLDNSEYAYSSLAFGKSYQIQAEYENTIDSTALSLPSLTTEALAAPGAPTIAYIKGNYGWLMARTVTGSYTYVLAIPSIITNTGTTSGNKIEITAANALSGTLLFHGRSLKNASAFNPNLTPVFSGTGKVLTTLAEITSLMTKLRDTYANSGTTDVKSNTNIASLIAMSTGSLIELWGNLVKNDLGIIGGNGGGGGGNGEGGGGGGTVYKSCLDLKNAWNTTNWSYSITPDGTPINVYCDMTTDWWWWTLVGGTNTSGSSNGEWQSYVAFTTFTATSWWKLSQAHIDGILSSNTWQKWIRVSGSWAYANNSTYWKISNFWWDGRTTMSDYRSYSTPGWSIGYGCWHNGWYGYNSSSWSWSSCTETTVSYWQCSGWYGSTSRTTYCWGVSSGSAGWWCSDCAPWANAAAAYIFLR